MPRATMTRTAHAWGQRGAMAGTLQWVEPVNSLWLGAPETVIQSKIHTAKIDETGFAEKVSDGENPERDHVPGMWNQH